MPKTTSSLAFLGSTASLATLAAVLTWSAPAAAADGARVDVPLAFPAGVTLVEVSKGEAYGPGAFLWRRLGDAHGNPLYTYTLEGHSGKSSCYGECAKEFPAFIAPRNAVAFGDWSLVERSEGKQWAYRGQPLYRYAGPPFAPPKFDIGNDTERGFGANLDPAGAGFSPKTGWSQAVYDPIKEIRTPADIRLELVEPANGYAFVIASSGLPLYLLDREPGGSADWTPYYASSLALPVADFSIVRRSDGTHQWAYKGQRLYSYNGDYSSTDIGGVTQPGAHVALAYRFVMPRELAIKVLPARAPMITTAKGLSVYTEAPYHLQYGGRETRGGYHDNYEEGKVVGTVGCTGECTRTWRPVLAPADAQGWGFWEILSRADGSRQWAYKGSALYTYVGDKVPGDIKGNNKAVIMYADAHDKIDALLGEGFSGGVGGSGYSSGTRAAGSTDLMSLVGGKVLTPDSDYGASFGAGFYWHLVPLFD
jgi:predicted lipoprotein with Yx(FWY)xxD motif